MAQTLKDLKENPKNPRKITENKLALLKKAVFEFGDLSGFVYNRKTRHLVSGHQRRKIMPAEAVVVLEKVYKKATRVGTMAVGFVEVEGERFAYREVDWDDVREKAATIAANNNAGAWDMPLLADWIKELDEFSSLELTLFEDKELDAIFDSVAEGVTLDESPRKATSSSSSDTDLLRGGTHRMILFFSPAEYTKVLAKAEHLMRENKLSEMSALFIWLLEQASPKKTKK